MASNKVNGSSFAGEFLGKNLDFYSISFTGNSILAANAGGDAASQARLDRVIEIVAMNGQPILLAAPTGSGPYVLKFAIEHVGAWENPLVANTLRDSLVANQGTLRADGSTSLWTTPLTTSNVTVTNSATI